jgi:hypothetical protein
MKNDREASYILEPLLDKIKYESNATKHTKP